MASYFVGHPPMGPKRELKFPLEPIWVGKSSAADLEAVAKGHRASIWTQMVGAGVKWIPSNTFSYYDQVLDTTAMLGAVPPRYGFAGGEIGFDTYFSMARGNAILPAMEMTKWFDTNCHYIVPELGPEIKFAYSSHKAVAEYKEAKEKLDLFKANNLGVNPDCGLKTRKYPEVGPALTNMVASAKLMPARLAIAMRRFHPSTSFCVTANFKLTGDFSFRVDS